MKNFAFLITLINLSLFCLFVCLYVHDITQEVLNRSGSNSWTIIFLDKSRCPTMFGVCWIIFCEFLSMGVPRKPLLWFHGSNEYLLVICISLKWFQNKVYAIDTNKNQKNNDRNYSLSAASTWWQSIFLSRRYSLQLKILSDKMSVLLCCCSCIAADLA